MKILLVCFSAALLAACAPLRNTVQRVYLVDDVWRANRHFKKTQYQLAAANYQKLIPQYPEGRTKQSMMIRKAESFYYIREAAPALADSFSAYRDYLERYPHGLYVKAAQDGMYSIEANLADREKAANTAKVKIEDDIEKLQAALKAEPYNAELHLQLGNALWNLRLYEQAALAYLESTKINAALKEYKLIQSRIEVLDNGDIIVLTPDERLRREIKRHPVVIENLNYYASRGSQESNQSVFGAPPRQLYYYVIGEARNRGERHLRDVVVQVKFYNAARKLLYVDDAAIGNMPPGAVRAFKVRAENQNDIYNITDYECQAFEQ